MSIGGSMQSMFYGLVAPVEKEACELALRRAIIWFCEAFRLSSIFHEMIRRMIMREPASQLSDQAWYRIRGWKVLSRFLIELGKYGKKMDGELTKKLVTYSGKYGISTFQDLTDEVKVLLYSDEFLLTKSVKNVLAHKKGGMGIEDPKFPRL
jgi:hypothetical protein